MQYEDITKRIIASAMRVHSALGNGFQEVLYQRAMEIELLQKASAEPNLFELCRGEQKSCNEVE